MNGGFMSAEIVPACRAEEARPYGSSAQERGSLGTLSWQRVAKIAGLAGAVAALAALSIAAGHMARVAGPPTRAHSTSVVSPQRAPVPRAVSREGEPCQAEPRTRSDHSCP
jgi:hypothetical protein